MIKLEHVVLASPDQMKFIIEGMRNPMNSWERRIKMKDIACKKCSWKDKCEGNKQQCRVDVFIDDFCKKCDFWNTESLICMFGELDCDDPDRRKCREFLGLKGDKND